MVVTSSKARDAAIYYATFGPSITVEQWPQRWLHTTY